MPTGAEPDAGTAPRAAIVTGAISNGMNVSVLGASICLLGSSVCTTTGQSGGFELAGVPSGRAAITATSPDFTTTIWPLTIAGTTVVDGVMWPSITTSTYAAEAHASFGGATGAIAFTLAYADGQGVAGAQVTVMGGAAVAYFPAYASTENLPLDATLTSTSTDGAGYAFGIEPGTASLSIEGAEACAPAAGNGWGAAATGAIPVPVAAGAVTVVTLACE